MKIVIAGGRDFNNYQFFKKSIDKLIQNIEKVEIVSGGAKGADSLGERYARENNLNIHLFPADWENLNVPGTVIKTNKYGKYNAAAGHQRNKKMAEFADWVIVFWNGSSKGTKNMIGIAKDCGLQVKIIKYISIYH